MLPLFPPADGKRRLAGSSRCAAPRLNRETARLAVWIAVLAAFAWPAVGQSQPFPPAPGPEPALAPLPPDTPPELLMPGVPQPPAAELPPPWLRDPCVTAALPPNPALPDSLLPDPLLPSPEVIPQTYCDGPFGSEGPPAACPPPRWLVSGGAVFLSRSEPFHQPLLLGGASGGAVEIDASDFEFDLEAGPLVDLMFFSPLGWQLEARYFSVAAWSSRHEFNDIVLFPVGRLLFDDTNESVPVTEPFLQYESDLYSTEFNFRRPVGHRFVGIVGFRWVELQEEYAASALERPTRFRHTNAVNYATHNHMYGLQLGTDVKLLDRGGPLRIDSSFKAGIYYNEADVRATRAVFQPFRREDGTEGILAFRRADSDEEGHASFLGEITLGATWQVRKCLAVRGGWQLLWLEGVALAPEQLTTTTLGDPTIAGTAADATVNTDGSPFYHGPYASIEAVW